MDENIENLTRQIDDDLQRINREETQKREGVIDGLRRVIESDTTTDNAPEALIEAALYSAHLTFINHHMTKYTAEDCRRIAEQLRPGEVYKGPNEQYFQEAVNVLFSILGRYCSREDFQNILSDSLGMFSSTFRYAKVDNEIISKLSNHIETPNVENMPSGSLLDLTYQVITSRGNLEGMEKKNALVSHNTGLKISSNNEDDKKKMVSRKSDKDSYYVEITDISRLGKFRGQIENVFMYVLVQLNKQALFNGRIITDTITFPLRELVENGTYKSMNSARAGFLYSMSVLATIKIFHKSSRKTKNVTSSKAGFQILFDGAEIDNSQCIVYLNKKIDWSDIASFYSLLPNYYYRLSSHAKSLTYSVFYLARQNVDSILNYGSFTISLRAVQQRLNLPLETETEHPQRDIIEAIDNALEEVETQNITYFPDGQFNLLLVFDDGDQDKQRNTRDYLDHGKIKVTFSGELASRFIDLGKQKKEKIRQAQQKQRRIEEKAAAIRLENEDSQGTDQNPKIVS